MSSTIESLLLALCLCCVTAARAAGEARPIVIWVNNWAVNIAVANLWKSILAKKGYKVTVQPGDKAIIYSGVGQVT